jgi:hypothetical protein
VIFQSELIQVFYQHGLQTGEPRHGKICICDNKTVVISYVIELYAVCVDNNCIYNGKKITVHRTNTYTKFAQNEVQKGREGRESLGAVGLASQRAGSKPLVITVGYFTG